MKVCSAWNWDTLDYTHYKCPGNISEGGWSDVNPATGPRARPKDPIGKDIEAFLPALPLGCVAVGKSPRAKGQIVRAPRQPFNGFGAPPTSDGLALLPQRPLVNLAVGAVFLVGLVWATGRALVPAKK